jgi:transposase-like protein
MEKRRIFSREFKLAAVRKIVEQGLSYSVVGRDLGVGANLVRNWKKTFEQEGTLETEVTASQSVEAELKRLREENRQLKMERDILKKVAPRSLGKGNDHALMN